MKNTKLFDLNFSGDCLTMLALKMKEMIVAPNEILFKLGDIDSRLFFLLDGEIELSISKKNNKHEYHTHLSKLIV